MTRRYTDTTLTLLVKNRDLSNAQHVYVTISQYIPDDVDLANTGSSWNYSNMFDKKEITIESNSISYTDPNTIVIVNISQEQNGQFKEGYVRIQINWIDQSGKRKATVVKRLKHHENLHEEVL